MSPIFIGNEVVEQVNSNTIGRGGLWYLKFLINFISFLIKIVLVILIK